MLDVEDTFRNHESTQEAIQSNMHIDPKLGKYREQTREADKLVFVYPIWWGRPPAMLLGYIDRKSVV